MQFIVFFDEAPRSDLASFDDLSIVLHNPDQRPCYASPPPACRSYLT